MALVSCLAASVVAQLSKKGEPVASVNLRSGEVSWNPHVPGARFVLTVSAPGGEVFQKEFESGSIPSFRLVTDKGIVLPDGQYKYELRVVPNLAAGVRETLAASRESGDSDQTLKEFQRAGLVPSTSQVQSGSFLVDKGAIVTGGIEAATPEITLNRERRTPPDRQVPPKKPGDGEFTLQDQVIPDDLIVQGSACVGLDCVNNENFGFDTIRMKENNLRIKFEDTSTQAGFPTTDWQLTANDSAAGGLNKFSIEDITGVRVPFTIEGGSTTNSIYVDSTGRVGFRTSTPVLDLHVATSNTPAHRLEQNNSGGFTAQTWDVAGNEANFFIRDVTGGSLLPFRIRPGAPTSSLDIAASGNVGIGT
jgi:hypothetical protein